MRTRPNPQLPKFTHVHNSTLLVVKIKVNIVKILFGEYIDNDFYFSLVKCLK